MSEIYKDFAPLDSSKTPRFAEVATFMRTRSIPIDQAGVVDVGIVGVPFDLGTNFRPGSRFGPAGIREASRIIRSVNGHTYVAPFEIARIADLGDTPVHTVLFDESIQIITEYFRAVRENSIRPLSLGGDHTISLPILRGLVQSDPVGMIQFDAHTDTHDSARGSKINHGTPFRRAVEEGLLDPKRVVQIGLRSTISAQNEYDWARSVGMTLITMDDYESMGRTAVIEEARRIVGNGRTYLSFDIDGLDAVYCPGTGVPEPGGFSMRDALVMLRGLRGINFIGGDICEVSPYLDAAGITSMHAANLSFELLCLLAEASRDYAA
ncbi:agmatinase [Rhizobium mayense]|uniref:Agmatinase n=1 Tax=Rhizobium mayense TaxID=1312184 RepID=A0ABT7K3W0_9HYPH|nr:agmatinase [Rhizobium mayense]MDL2403304.1 agmatinase [Rhizobium mayense]